MYWRKRPGYVLAGLSTMEHRIFMAWSTKAVVIVEISGFR